MNVYHILAGAQGRMRLVEDDDERHGIVDGLASEFGDRLLTYCLMDTHLHTTAEAASEAEAVKRLSAALTPHIRARNRRVGKKAELLRGPIDVKPITSPEQLARAIEYDHKNPCRTTPPLAKRAFEWRWSGARAFGGLSLSTAVNVPRALERCERFVGWARGPRIELVKAPLPEKAGAKPAPTASPEVLLAAAADALGVRRSFLPAAKRAPELSVARSLFLRLGEIEAYSLAQLAPYLAISSAHASRVAAVLVPERAVRIALTLLADPALRRQLRPPPRADPEAA